MGERALLSTPLDALHRSLGAKMAPFAGYDMPVHYEAGVLREHLHTRNACGLFDVSHMGQVWLNGPDGIAALETLIPADLQNLAGGRLVYTMLTNDQGGILDDLLVTQEAGDLFMVLNAARKEANLAYIQARIGDRVGIQHLRDQALIAIQGPKAANVIDRFLPTCKHMVFMTSTRTHFNDVPCFVTRSGYAGEDGFEVSLPADAAENFVELLLGEEEVEMAGLGARDSLRLEAGLCLYGQDIDETTTPIEAGLGWTIPKRRREEGGFPGAGVILSQLKNGPSRRLKGIRAEGKAPARAGTDVTDKDGRVIGRITSGGFGPTLKGPVAMGYVESAHAKDGALVDLMVRGKAMPARVADLPFIKKRYVKN